MLSVAEAITINTERVYREWRDTLIVRTLGAILTPSPERVRYLRTEPMRVRTLEEWNAVAEKNPEMNVITDRNLYSVMLKDARTHRHLSELIAGIVPE